MKRRIYKIIAILLLVVFLLFCVPFFLQGSLMYGNKTVLSDNLRYYTHNIFKSCFVGDYTWPAGEKYAVLDIPDACEGYRVTSLGGYIGSGGPCPFDVNLPNAASVHMEGTLPEDAQIEQYHLVINIGKYIQEDGLIVMDGYHKVGNDRFVQILVTVNCSPENPVFYSENGKLYKRADDSPVDGFFYYSDYMD